MDWKNVFIEKLMTNDIPGALEIKRMNIPDRLYQFRSVNTIERLNYVIDDINCGQLFMNVPSNFNDPFEAKSVLRSNKAEHYMGKGYFIGSMYSDVVLKYFGADKVKELEDCDDWYERYWQMFIPMIASQMHSTNERVQEIINDIQMNEIESRNRDINSIQVEWRVACFTKCFKNLPMWNHYADKYSGVCLEYDITSIKDALFINRLFPVFYVKQLPDTLHKIATSSTFARMLDYQIIHKLLDWAYEKEWRLVFDQSTFELRVNPTTNKVDFIKPSKILLGSEIDKMNEEIIRKKASSALIPVAKMSVTEYGFEAIC